jgi:hypothetical protein
VEERLFLDGLSVGGHGCSEDQGDQAAATVLPDAANAGPVGPDQAAMGAGEAADRAIGLWLRQDGGDGKLIID